MTAVEKKPTCAECKLFDPNNVDGTPVGTAIGADKQEIILGRCRGLMGGLWGPTLTPQTPCRQPAGIFQPKEKVEPSSAA